MKQLDPKAVWFFFFQFAIGWVIPAIVFGFVFPSIFAESELPIADELALWVAVAFVALMVLSFIWAKLTYHFYRYEAREDGFRKEHGVIWKRYVTIPYDRIQNVDIYRGIVARILGLSDLQIQTAGAITAGSYGAFSEGRLPGLSKAEAETLRDELVRRARSSRSAQGV